jgi:zinc transport system substrate-binding protein
MLKKTAALLLCLLTALAFTACAGGSAEKAKISKTDSNKIQVTVIIPDGTEPHDYEPKARDLISLSTADVFVYSGLGMETWAGQAVQAAGNKKLITVEASSGETPISASGGQNGHSQYDPHIWISLKGAELEAKNIDAALDRADPADKAYFDKNCAGFTAQLESLFNEYKAKFNGVKDKNFVTGHAAFAYLCRDFGLKQESVEDVFADGEPSAQKLVELMNYCRKNGVKTIFVEDMVSPDVSNTLASEVGAKVETIYTIESAEGGKTYLERMEANLSKIYHSLT